jgi:hypothetical protein
MVLLVVAVPVFWLLDRYLSEGTRQLVMRWLPWAVVAFCIMRWVWQRRGRGKRQEASPRPPADREEAK